MHCEEDLAPVNHRRGFGGVPQTCVCEGQRVNELSGDEDQREQL